MKNEFLEAFLSNLCNNNLIYFYFYQQSTVVIADQKKFIKYSQLVQNELSLNSGI